MKSPNLEVQSDARKSLLSPVFQNNSRGARFLDLVRTSKLDVSPQLSKKRKSSNKLNMDLMKVNKIMKEDTGVDYLNFSPANHYDPNSSPSQSILSKRNQTPDSPATLNGSAKRKRVSFNDPVSTTKQYLITEEEERQKSNHLIRCLTYENQEEEEDVIMEIDESEIDSNSEIISVKEEQQTTAIKQDFEEKDILPHDLKPLAISLDHNYDEKDEITQNTDITTSSIEEEIPMPSHHLVFKDRSELMDYITKNLTVDELFERLTQAEEESLKRKELIEKVFRTIDMNELLTEILPSSDLKNVKMSPEQTEVTSTIIDHISRLMKSNDRVKHKVLDTLSEKHSKAFLTHALQESSPSSVLDKLTIPNIVTYLIHKVNVCEDDEVDMEVNKINRAIMHHLLKKTHNHQEIVSDQKETQELLKLLFKNKPKIDILDTVHEFLRGVIQQK